jgi:hypothetical protein
VSGSLAAKAEARMTAIGAKSCTKTASITMGMSRPSRLRIESFSPSPENLSCSPENCRDLPFLCAKRPRELDRLNQSVNMNFHSNSDDKGSEFGYTNTPVRDGFTGPAVV